MFRIFVLTEQVEVVSSLTLSCQCGLKLVLNFIFMLIYVINYAAQSYKI